MSESIVWKGLAHVRSRPSAQFSGLGAYVDVLVLAADEENEDEDA